MRPSPATARGRPRARPAAGRLAGSPPRFVIFAAVLAPLGGLVYFAAHGSGDVWPNLIANVLPYAMRTTVLLLTGVGVLTAAIGVGTAWLVTMFRFPGKRVFEWALLLPLAVPTYIVAYAYLDVMHPLGPVQTTLRAILGITGRAICGSRRYARWAAHLPARCGALPLCLSAGARALPDAIGGDARGCAHARRRPVARLFRVALPLARPAIAVGVSLALMEALNDIGASEFLGVWTLTVAIYTTWVVRMSVEGAAQIALVMLAVVFALLLVERWARRRQRFSAHAQRHHAPTPRQLSGAAGAGASLACSLPIFFGFLIPVSYLVYASWTRSSPGLPPELADGSANRDAGGHRHRSSRSRSGWSLPMRSALSKSPAAPDRAARHDRLRPAGHGARRRASGAARHLRQRSTR